MPQETPTVFVVDDDISVRESLEALIQSVGWQPEVYASAQEFLSRPPALGPSCLILDVNLPDLNGLDLQTCVVADRTDMPIIFITGYGDVPTTVRAMKGGAVEFLTKPFKERALLAAIEQAIERSRAALDVEEELRVLRARYATLSRREREVMSLVVSGLLNKQLRARHQRNHGKSASRPGDAENGGTVACGVGDDGRSTPPPCRAQALNLFCWVCRNSILTFCNRVRRLAGLDAANPENR